MLDARTPAGVPSNYQEEERKREEEVEKEVDRLMVETRWWRVANSAQWVAWGIVQANVPELDEEDAAKKVSTDSSVIATPGSEGPESTDGGPKAQVDGAEGSTEEIKQETDENANVEEGEEEFDYITYAQERAMFFWGDCVDLGIAKKEDLPENLRERIKVIGY